MSGVAALQRVVGEEEGAGELDDGGAPGQPLSLPRVEAKQPGERGVEAGPLQGTRLIHFLVLAMKRGELPFVMDETPQVALVASVILLLRRFPLQEGEALLLQPDDVSLT